MPPEALWVALGAAVALAFLAVGPRKRARAARVWWAAGLVVAQLLHVVFAFGDGLGGLALQAVGVVAFAAFARAGVSGRSAWLAAGWLLHPAWDLGLGHSAPAWYVWACLGFDVVVGAVLYLRAVRR